MNHAVVDPIVNAVLYEGYILYPYRPSVKNRQRWTFGGLYPQAYSLAQGGTDPWTMQTECLVQGGPDTRLEITVRFLHLVARTVGELPQSFAQLPDHGEPAFRAVETLQIGDRCFRTWQEAAERAVSLAEQHLGDLADRPEHHEFSFPAARQIEPLREPGGAIVGLLVRQQESIAGSVQVAAALVGEGLYRVTVKILNRTALEENAATQRDAAVMRGLISTHTILGVCDGQFLSLIDPPPSCAEAASACRNVGTWPVLVGAEGDRDTLLSSPIILYDYPQVAPESPGDLFDATEIDEILTLRILTLTEDEKRAMMSVDERGRALLERTETLAQEQLAGLHGAVRRLRPVETEGS